MKQNKKPKKTYMNPVTLLVAETAFVKKRDLHLQNWNEKLVVMNRLKGHQPDEKERKKLAKQKFYFFKSNRKKSGWWAVISGLFIGFINGFWGGGGGMVCVPTLTQVFALPEKKAHATAILVILPLSIASFVVYLFKGDLDFQNIWYITCGFVVGGVAGALILSKMNNVILRLIFGIIIIIAGIRMVW